MYLAVRQKGTANTRGVVQPIAIRLQRNSAGQKQKITFDAIPDVKLGTASVPLTARSDAGLPAGFFVVAGPAIVENGRLIFTKLPPRTRFPVTVTVAAWQWGRDREPKVQMAEIVKQTFHIVDRTAK
jgi:hypothetical protein